MHSSSSFAKGLAGVALSSAFVLCSLWVNGCTAIVNDATDYCSTNAECASKGGVYENSVCRDGLCRDAALAVDPTGADWSCVGKVTYEAAPQITVNFNVATIDPVSGAPIPGMSVRPCGRVDTACSAPITQPVVTDVFGIARLILPTVQATQGVPGFTGYLEVTGPGRSSYLYQTNPLTVERMAPAVLPIGSPDSAAGFVQALGGFIPDPTLAAGALIAKDCKGAAAAGVSARIPEGKDQARFFYVAGVAPSPNATATDPSGIVFIFNIPIGNVTFEMYRAVSDVKLGQLSVLTRTGYSSLVEMTPTPL